MARVDWASLGLTGNPFENVQPGEHLEWVSVPPALAAALERPRFRVELVGEKGAGKTTTLRWYAATHAGARFHYVDAPKLDVSLDGVRVLCLDEANVASPAELARVGRLTRERGVSLLVSTHWSLAKHLGEMETFVLDTVELQGLEWVARRVASRALPGGALVDFSALAAVVAPRVGFVNYGVQRVLYEYAETLARGSSHEAALADAFRRVAEDDSIRMR